jgi:hypothetical protein
MVGVFGSSGLKQVTARVVQKKINDGQSEKYHIEYSTDSKDCSGTAEVSKEFFDTVVIGQSVAALSWANYCFLRADLRWDIGLEKLIAWLLLLSAGIGLGIFAAALRGGEVAAPEDSSSVFKQNPKIKKN